MLLRIEDYYRAFYQTSSNYLLNDWHLNYFMIFNDQSTNPGSKSCGPTCTKHLFKITSDCDQTIMLAASVWPQKSYPANKTSIKEKILCQEAVSNSKDYPKHLVEVYLNDVLIGGFKFTEGTELANFNGLKSVKLSTSDVLRVEFELAWNRPNISKDFSL